MNAAASLVTLLALAPAAVAQVCPSISASANWKPSIGFPTDPFRADSGAADEPGWVKFTMLECDGNPIHYQHSGLYDFHFDFATAELDPFVGFSPIQYENVTLFEIGREALLGAVVLPPLEGGFLITPVADEYGIQFTSLDPIDPQTVVDRFNAIVSSVNAGPNTQAFYFPTFEQQGAALSNEAFFNANGIEISSPARWAASDVLYSRGWAIGELKFFPADQIDAAFLSGALETDDILLTDGIPADLPLVAGVLTTVPSTPNSHVAIQANTFQQPFAFLADTELVQRAQDLVGRNIVLRALDGPLGEPALKLIDVEDELTLAQIADLAQLKLPPPLDLSPAQNGVFSVPTDGLVPSDIQFYGGKAANFGFLRRAIPGSSPVSAAISFELWSGFLDQTLASGISLRDEVDAVLSQHSWPPADVQAFANDMASLRDMFKDDAVTSFTPAQEAAVIAVLVDAQFGFDPLRRIRFRSSTNVEDSDQFTGAGLYDSKSGCLADTLDGDSVGPSHCEIGEPDEKGVFRAIRRVFASFYNDAAVLERLRHGVVEADVGMALLVHHSFPDPEELANGVATLTRDAAGDRFVLVTQLGAESVTNPDGLSTPEVVELDETQFSPQLELTQSSSLVQLGDEVMDWTQDYDDLVVLLRAVADRFQLETGKTEFVLDFEYKKMLPANALVVKQVREIPQPSTTPSVPTFLVNEPLDLAVRGGGLRVAGQWRLETKNMWLDPVALQTESVFAKLQQLSKADCHLLTLGLDVEDLPLATHAYDAQASETTDSWTLDFLTNPRTYTLTTPIPTLVSPAESPILVLSDFMQIPNEIEGKVTFQDPIAGLCGGTAPMTQHFYFDDRPPVERTATPTGRFFDFGGITVDTVLYAHPSPPSPNPLIVCSGCVPSLSHFGQTIITGLTTNPIVLTGPLHGTWTVSNHHFFENFSFDLQADPGLTAQQRAELEAAGVGQLNVTWSNFGPSTFMLCPGEVCTPQIFFRRAPAGGNAAGAPAHTISTAPVPVNGTLGG